MLLFVFPLVEVCGVGRAIIKGSVRARGAVEPGPVINDPFGLEPVHCPAGDCNAICRKECFHADRWPPASRIARGVR